MLTTAAGQRATVPHKTWTARKAAHERRVDALIAPHLERRRRGIRHPVEDFLFTYYSHRPAQLQRWHPGAVPGVAQLAKTMRQDMSLEELEKYYTEENVRKVLY